MASNKDTGNDPAWSHWQGKPSARGLNAKIADKTILQRKLKNGKIAQPDGERWGSIQNWKDTAEIRFQATPLGETAQAALRRAEQGL